MSVRVACITTGPANIIACMSCLSDLLSSACTLKLSSLTNLCIAHMVFYPPLYRAKYLKRFLETRSGQKAKHLVCCPRLYLRMRNSVALRVERMSLEVIENTTWGQFRRTLCLELQTAISDRYIRRIIGFVSQAASKSCKHVSRKNRND